MASAEAGMAGRSIVFVFKRSASSAVAYLVMALRIFTVLEVFPEVRGRDFQDDAVLGYRPTSDSDARCL